MSIYEVSAKLVICYMLSLGNFDKLMLYATLLLCVQISVMGFYRFYCVRNFQETKYSFSFDKKIFKEISGFSGWSLISTSSIALSDQGVLILLNLFFSPAIVAARSISLQVNAAANQFVGNFRQAANPQIVKKYAVEDYEGSKHLLLSSAKYSYYMMFLISLSICVLAYPLLHFWLGIVPDYAVPFLQIVIVQSLFQVFDTSLYTALYAKGRLKENALISPALGFLIFPITYVYFKLGFSPLILSWTSLIVYALLGCVVKPILIIKIVDYTWRDIWSVFKPCIIVTLISFPLPVYISSLINTSNILNFIIVGFATMSLIIIVIYLFGIDSETKIKLRSWGLDKIKLRN